MQTLFRISMIGLCFGTSALDSTTTTTATTTRPVIPMPPGLAMAPPPPSISTISQTSNTSEQSNRTVDLGYNFIFSFRARNPCPPWDPCEKLTIHNLNLTELWPACLFSSDNVHIAVDSVLSLTFPIPYNAELCLYNTTNEPEGTFESIELDGSSSCTDVETFLSETGNFMLIFKGTTCTAGTSGRFSIFNSGK